MDEIKKEVPTSFRLDIDVLNSFKELAKAHNFTQNETMQNLLDVFELQNAKKSLIERKKEIETFEDYLQKMVSLYLNSLQLNQDGENRIREELSKQISAKDKTIQDLHEKTENYDVKLKIQREELSESSRKLEELTKANNILTDLSEKNKTIAMQNDEQIKMLTTLLAEHKEYKNKNITLETANKDLTQKNRELEHHVKDLTMQITNHITRIEQQTADIKGLKEELANEKKVSHELRAENKQDIAEIRKTLEQASSEKLLVEKQKYENELEKLRIQANLEKSREKVEKKPTNTDKKNEKQD